MRLIYILFTLTLIFSGCAHDKNNRPTPNEVPTISINQLKQVSPYFTTTLLDNCRFVKLETSEKCLIGFPEKMEVFEDRLYILDDNHKLFVFRTDGSFVNEIGRIGKGPGEMISMTGFYINKEKRFIGICDVIGMKICRFTLDGTHLGSYNIDSKIWGYLNGFDNFGEGMLLLEYRNNLKTPNQYALVREEDYSLVKYCIPYISVGTEFCGYGRKPTCTSSFNNYYAPAMFSDTIYTYQEGDLVPRWILDSGLKHADAATANQKGPYECGYDGEKNLQNLGYSVGLTNIFTTRDYLYIPAQPERAKAYEIFWNLKEQKGFYSLNEHRANVFTSLYYLYSCTEEELVCVIPVGQAMLEQQGEYAVKHPKVLEVMSKTKEEDNPIIGFYKIPAFE